MIFAYALATLWHERQRYWSAVLAVAFSAALISLQCGLLLGLFAMTSAPIDQSSANIWVGAPHVLSLDLGRPISENRLARLASLPGVRSPETYLLDYGYWVQKDGSKELCIVIGTRLGPDALGTVRPLTPDLRARLSEPGAIVIDAAERGRLGVRGPGDYVEISGRRVHIVGLVRGLRSLTGAYVFCSIDTARQLVPIHSDEATYFLARCPSERDARRVVEQMRTTADLSAYTAAEFSLRTRLYWLTMTKAGVSMGFTASLGLLVGAVVTSQTLYAATLASVREFAVVRALGIPRWRIAAAVLAQSFIVGMAGLIVAVPVVLVLARLADMLGTRMLLPPWLLSATVTVTLLTALGSGATALRSLRLMDPATLLR